MAKRKATSDGLSGLSDVDQVPAEVELSTGKRVALDGDLVFLIDTLYREFAQRHGFAPSFGDVQRELAHVIEQMPAEQRQEYFMQSLFLNYVTYENEMAERLVDEIAKKGTNAPTTRRPRPK